MTSICLDGLDGCTRCTRLVAFMTQLAPSKGRLRTDYHNGPVNGFGDLQARICLVGLAPGAHGANRTGRPFTGDGAGVFMYPLLHQAGLSNQAEVVATDDGLELHDLYITNAVKCLPPENRPNADEFSTCRPYLEKELKALQGDVLARTLTEWEWRDSDWPQFVQHYQPRGDPAVYKFRCRHCGVIKYGLDFG